MYQRDYILRMIEMLGELIAGILGLIKKGSFTQASEKLNRIYYDMLKQDAIFFKSIPEEKLTGQLLQDHNFTNGHLEILAELFNAEAELEMAQGNLSESLEFSEKSLILLEFIDREQKIFSLERINRINELKNRIGKLNQNNHLS